VHLWDLADLLYQAKSGGAVRFLKEACALGARALHIRVGAMREDEEGGEQEEGWKQLDGQLFWRVGATCGVLFQVWGSKVAPTSFACPYGVLISALLACVSGERKSFSICLIWPGERR
jgi:hypothetical protein